MLSFFDAVFRSSKTRAEKPVPQHTSRRRRPLLPHETMGGYRFNAMRDLW
jgi:hypothetical protein